MKHMSLSTTDRGLVKTKELDALTDAVADEFRRLRAIDHRNRYVCSLLYYAHLIIHLPLRGLGIPNRFEPVDMNGDTKDVDWRIVAEKVRPGTISTPLAPHQFSLGSGFRRRHMCANGRRVQGQVVRVQTASIEPQ